MDVEPDGFIGMVMAVEGISDATVLLHGPDGCRKNLAVLSNKCYPRHDTDIRASTPYYRGMARIPCTGVDSHDYIHGAYRKLSEALKFVGEREDGMIAVVCSPGASLIGDDWMKAVSEAGMAGRTLILDSSLMSQPLSISMDLTMKGILESLDAGDREKVPGTVNLLGLNVLMKDWTSVISEFTEILSLMDLEVVSCPGAGSSMDDIRRSFTAEYNIILCPEYSMETSSLYKERFGIDPISIGYSPVGFDATESLIREVSRVTGRSPSKALDYISNYKERAFNCMMASMSNVAGRSYSIEGDLSVVYPLVRWLFESLGMVPCYVRCRPSSSCSFSLLDNYLEQTGILSRLEDSVPEFTDYVFSDGNTAQLREASDCCRRGIDIMFPSKMNVDFRPSPVFGASGAMYILDRVINPF